MKINELLMENQASIDAVYAAKYWKSHPGYEKTPEIVSATAKKMP